MYVFIHNMLDGAALIGFAQNERPTNGTEDRNEIPSVVANLLLDAHSKTVL